MPKKAISIHLTETKLDTTVPTVRLCLNKYLKQVFNQQLKTLLVAVAKPKYLMIDSKTWVINIACQKSLFHI